MNFRESIGKAYFRIFNYYAHIHYDVMKYPNCEYILNRSDSEGYIIKIERQETGTWNGYVTIPSSHPYANETYHTLNDNYTLPKELTYVGSNEYGTEFGFDHNREYDTEFKYYVNYDKVYKEVIDLFLFFKMAEHPNSEYIIDMPNSDGYIIKICRNDYGGWDSFVTIPSSHPYNNICVTELNEIRERENIPEFEKSDILDSEYYFVDSGYRNYSEANYDKIRQEAIDFFLFFKKGEGYVEKISDIVFTAAIGDEVYDSYGLSLGIITHQSEKYWHLNKLFCYVSKKYEGKTWTLKHDGGSDEMYGLDGKSFCGITNKMVSLWDELITRQENN